MCGRGAQTSDPETIARRFGVVGPLPNLQARYNVAPLQEVGVVRRNPKTGARALDPLVWGLVPHWSSSTKPTFNSINARAETVATTRAYRDAWQAGRRCLVPFDLFYEWQAVPGSDAKQPYAIARKDRAPLGMAGLWEGKRLDGDAVLRSFTIITTTANASLASLHERMPVILAPDAYDAWLGDTAASPDDLHALLRPCPDDWLEFWPVDARVGNWRNDDPGLIEPLAAAR
jgi:putative SOS response-associated peptidase YedK